MIVAVTGASGHIGANLVRTLLHEGRQVRALVREDSRGLEDLGIERIFGDIRDPASLDRLFSGADVAYHLAAIISISRGDEDLLGSVNVKGTQNVVESCLKSNIRRLIHFSSIHAIEQKPMQTTVDETRPLVDSPQCPPYDRSKALAEREIRKGIENGLDAVIMSPTGVIGPHDYQLSLFGEVLLNLAQGTLPALVEGGFNWVDVRDVVEAAIKAEQLAPTAAKYLLSGQYATISDMAKLVEGMTGKAAPRLIIPKWMALSGAPIIATFSQLARKRPLYTSIAIKTLDNCNLNISHNRATQELGYHPRPLSRTIFETLCWYQNSGAFNSTVKLIPPQEND
jgi:dihydroflavonol-4-reductase